MDLVAIGEPMIALVGEVGGPLAQETTFHSFVVGAEVNVAIGLSRLGRRCSLIGRTGADPFGTMVRDTLAAEGVHMGNLRDDDAPTGVLFRSGQATGTVEVSYRRAASAGSRLDASDIACRGHLDTTRWVHVSGVTLALSESARTATRLAMQRVHAHGGQVSFDLNHRRRLWTDDVAAPTLRALLPLADVVWCTDSEASLVVGTDGDGETLANALIALGASAAVVRCGIVGATVHDGHRAQHVDGQVVQPVDVIGAGDAFVAGSIDALLDGLDLATAVARGHHCARFAVQSLGDTTGMPDRGALAAERGSVESRRYVEPLIAEREHDVDR